ncbi:MAG: tetratricopeptide repeat protein [Betaproteobacteria bacterium]
MNLLARTLKLWWLQRRANAALLFKRTPEAVRAYREMLEIDPRNEMAGLMLGNLLAESGDRAGAVAQLEQFTAAKPSCADAWFNLGFLHDQEDRLADAERCFRRAVELRPSLDRAWYGLGLVLIRDGRLTEAVDALKQTIKLQPFSPYGYYQLGLTYHHLGRSEDAWRVHKQLTEFEPKFSATLKRDLERTVPQAVPAIKPSAQPEEEKTADAT